MIIIVLVMLFTAAAVYAVWSYVLAPAVNGSAQSGIKRGAGRNKTEGTKLRTHGNENLYYIITAMLIAFILRIVLSAVFRGHATDMGCFEGWSDMIFHSGLSGFYATDSFHDYPPGYMYILYIIGCFRNWFHLTDGALWAVVKLPAALCDLAIGYLIYKLAQRKFSCKISAVIACLYLFNPAPILNGSLWGQVDSVYTFLALLMIYFITDKKMIHSYFAFALCLLVKPQAFIMLPVLVTGIAENVFLKDYSREKFIKNLLWGLGAIAVVFLLALPFGLQNVIEQYRATLNSYPHATVNAFNLWGAVGLNWAALKMIYQIVGYLFIAAIWGYTAYLILKSKNEGKYYFAGAFLAFMTYMLTIKMHERYAFPAIALTLAAFICMTNIKSIAVFATVSISQFFNTAWVLYIYETAADTSKVAFGAQFVVCSIVNLLCIIPVIYMAQREYIHNGIAPQKHAVQMEKGHSAPMRKDVIAMAVITAVYACVALYDLGDMHAAYTEYNLPGEGVRIDLGGEKYVGTMSFFLGSHELNGSRTIYFNGESADGENVFTSEIDSGSVFAWNEEEIDAEMRYITLSSNSDDLQIKEIALTDDNGGAIMPVSLSDKDANALFDEQDEIPEYPDFRNGTYFDEIYHARTAYEYIHGIEVYETTHPPLGKIIISLGIQAFGMNPFGWRIAGTLIGILMVPLIYLFALRLLKKTWLAVVTCLLFTFDFMHFAQTRISTIDVYITFFIMLMFYFMYRYCTLDFYDKKSFKKGLAMLALCGVATGLGIASKLTGLYAAMGLFVIMVLMLIKHIREYSMAKKDPSGVYGGVSGAVITERFGNHVGITVIWCIVFFIAVPLIIYLLSYIPFVNSSNGGENASFMDNIQTIWNNQTYMSWYHGEHVPTLKDHPYSSNWYEWITMRRPIWYFSATVTDGIKEGISSFGNPLVWWAGIPAFLYMIYRAIAKKGDKIAIFLIIAYLAELLPWMFVSRMTFIYHYFPSVPFIVLMIGYSLKCVYGEARNKKRAKYAIFGYAALVIVLFIMFYPVLSGQQCSVDYAEQYLKWFSGWVLL